MRGMNVSFQVFADGEILHSEEESTDEGTVGLAMGLFSRQLRNGSLTLPLSSVNTSAVRFAPDEDDDSFAEVNELPSGSLDAQEALDAAFLEARAEAARQWGEEQRRQSEQACRNATASTAGSSTRLRRRLGAVNSVLQRKAMEFFESTLKQELRNQLGGNSMLWMRDVYQYDRKEGPDWAGNYALVDVKLEKLSAYISALPETELMDTIEKVRR